MVDTRERYPFRFAGRDVTTERAALTAGDYGVRTDDGQLRAAVERKTLENLTASLSDGTLAFQMQRLTELPLAAVVVEGRYPALFELEHVAGAWLGDILARLAVRYPGVQVVFADSRRFAEDGRTGSWPPRSGTRPRPIPRSDALLGVQRKATTISRRRPVHRCSIEDA